MTSCTELFALVTHRAAEIVELHQPSSCLQETLDEGTTSSKVHEGQKTVSTPGMTRRTREKLRSNSARSMQQLVRSKPAHNVKTDREDLKIYLYKKEPSSATLRRFFCLRPKM